ncbi:MAG: N-acetyltransferase [Alphaproteobacteria bacterium]|uniref:GNAT family N-acetyltransferase n=1 Tax=Stappia sp. TaxID=1870903 RepID=UPI001EB90C17|nr:N-acetyltransferase [Alphaproteobacteria bacterium]
MTDTAITIELERSGAKGRYVATVANHKEPAELTFSVASDTLVIADHTGVPDSLRGTGVGHALVARLVEDARAGGFLILPLCPFVNAQRRKHPEWADAFKA